MLLKNDMSMLRLWMSSSFSELRADCAAFLKVVSSVMVEARSRKVETAAVSNCQAFTAWESWVAVEPVVWCLFRGPAATRAGRNAMRAAEEMVEHFMLFLMVEYGEKFF